MAAALALSLGLLVAHALHYAFLTDDAFISFRYAENLAHGRGLVFNEGDRVEGYTNFSWVALLALGSAIGLAPEAAAAPLSMLLTLVLWAVVTLHAARSVGEGRSRLWIVLPGLLLALTRSFALWSTGGLETRLFELLVAGGCVSLAWRLIDDREGRGPSFLPPALLFALACLTRPDGLLIAASCGLGALLLLLRRGSLEPRHLRAGLAFAGIVAAHLFFRRLYYGDWLPNTYYAKVGGEAWWAMGRVYLEAFVLEYAVWLWVPAVAVALRAHWRYGTWPIPLVFGLAVAPHAIYVMSIGGDHFEYRPLDLYFPLLLLLVADGARELAGDRKRNVLVAGYLAAVCFGLVAIPWQSHREFPAGYHAGFPAFAGVTPEQFGSASRGIAFWLPGQDWLQEQWQGRIWRLSRHFVGLRQEEHAAFLASVREEGLALHQAVELGSLRDDTHIALDSVGAIPYLSGLRTLDRLGLTDRNVARQASTVKLMAHAKRATFGYARSRGVDFWAADRVHLSFSPEDPNLERAARGCGRGPRRCWSAWLSEDRLLVAALPRGIETTRTRFPRLEWVPLDDEQATRALRSLPVGQRLRPAP
ncbi:MAG: hypothetical protein JRH19_17125 [Deltaproteobacteria bacterium]|nr:hypothetical protein [Deltaproteobacteria bacterium]